MANTASYWPLTWEVVDVSSVQQEMAVHGVTERGHVARERHAGSHVAPERARVVDPHLGLRDVRGDTEVGNPEVLGERERSLLSLYIYAFHSLQSVSQGKSLSSID